MKIGTLFFAGLLLTGSLVASDAAFAADGFLLREELAPDSDYCHLQFPAITEESLSTDNPILKSPDSGDIIDLYGPCDESPVGQNQIVSQRQDMQRRLNQDNGD
jgi:hypothetical protein